MEAFRTIAKSQCSLSEQDLTILRDAINDLESLKRKKGSTYKEVDMKVLKIVSLLNDFLNVSWINRIMLHQ